MEATYDFNTNGVLILTADVTEREVIKDLIAQKGTTTAAEYEALEDFIANSDLEWIEPFEIGALTDAPILGIRGEEKEVPAGMSVDFLRITSQNGDKLCYQPVVAAWGYMNYQVRSFLQDLVDTGKAVFTS